MSLNFSSKCIPTIIIYLLWVFNSAAQVTQTFTFTGAMQTFVVPPCVSTITVDVKGSQGGSNSAGILGGLGGSSNGVLSVAQGNTLYIYVGGMNGYNGGGLPGASTCTAAIGGFGGGASDIRLNGTALGNRVAVGAGGGGAGGERIGTCGRGTGGGGGGGSYGGGGGAGYPASSTTVPTGGTQTAGGSGGTSSFSPAQNGLPGVLGIGGNGGGETSSNQAGSNSAFPGGNGGGLIGSNGQQPPTNIFTGQSGAGGSCFLTALSGTTTTPGNRSGNGIVTLSYNFSGALTSALASPTAICIGNSSTLTAGGQVSYTWSPGGSNNNSVVVSPTTSSTYTIQGLNSLGCISTAVVSVSVDTAVPNLSVATTSASICAGRTVILTASGATTYTWTSGITNGLSYTPTGTSTYVVTGENACGTSTAAIAVTVNPLPLVTGSVNNPTVCNGSPVIFNGAGNAINYTWSGGVTDNVAFTPFNSGTYSVTGASVNGCTATAVVGVTVLITPTVTPVVTPTAVCFGVTATLSASGATGYTWTPGTNLSAATVTVSPPSSTTYTLFRTNGACSSTSTVNLVINPLPLVNASATPSQICAGTGINLLVFGAITYTWLPGGFNTASFTIFPNFSTTYTVTGSNGNCTTSVAVPIVVNPSPVISISTLTTFICQGQNATLTANGAGALTYTWQPSNSNNSSIVASPIANTVYTLSATNASNCTSSVSQVIIVNPLPNTAITSNQPFVCAGQTAILSVTPSPNVTYNWSTGGSGPSASVSPTITTNYFVTGINNGNGCSNTGTIALSVFISTFAVTSPTAICKGNVATLTASGPATAYSWITSTGVPVGNSASSITVSPASSTIYSVTGTNGSCSNTQSLNLIVNPIPNVIAQTGKSTICRFEVSTILASGATSYSWNTGVTSPSISVTLSLTTSYTITGTDVNGCAKTVTITQFVATCIGVDELKGNSAGGITVYPNPNNGNFTVDSDVNITLTIVNALGQTVSTVKLSDENKKAAWISNLPNGIYFLIGNDNDIKLSKKIIVER